MKSTAAAVLGVTLASLAGLVGCSNAEDGEEVGADQAATESSGSVDQGRNLFFSTTFSGNGRTCGDCHSESTGTINPAQVVARFKASGGTGSDKLFRWDGADKLGGNTFQRIQQHATVIVEIPLPANVSLVGSGARKVQLNRGIPTTKNIALDPVLMVDGRAPNLQEQARGAILGHAQSTSVSSNQLNSLAAFEKTLFNRSNLKSFASGGPAPTLPEGKTEAQKRGRVFFTDDFAEVQNGTAFRCVHCHSGPMLNETSPANELFTGGPDGPPGGPVPAGTRFANIGVSELNVIGNPVREYAFRMPDGTTQRFMSADPGRALVTGNALDVGAFKIGTLWGAKDTAPYFHDNSAKTLQQMVQHYKNFAEVALPPFLQLTDEHVADITAYMQLL